MNKLKNCLRFRHESNDEAYDLFKQWVSHTKDFENVIGINLNHDDVCFKRARGDVCFKRASGNDQRFSIHFFLSRVSKEEVQIVFKADNADYEQFAQIFLECKIFFEKKL